MKKILVSAMLIAASVMAFAQSFSKEEQALIDLSNQKWAWMAEKNADKLAELFLPESQFVHMGGAWGKQQEVDIIRSGMIWYKKADIHSQEVKFTDPNVATVYSNIHLTSEVGGHQVRFPFMVSEVYIRQKSKEWKLSSLIFTKLAEPDPRFSPSLTLNNGIQMPQFGLGTFAQPSNEVARESVLTALRMGYRHIDTAHAYNDEEGVGQGIKDSGIPREEIWLTSKLWIDEYGEGKTAKAIDDMLKRLQVDYIDLLYVHQPVGDFIGAWRDMEKAVRDGKVRALGISNFEVNDSVFDLIMEKAEIKPQVLQMECHPYAQRIEARQKAAHLGLQVECWFPLGGQMSQGALLKDPVIVEIAQRLKKSPAQIILRWHLQEGLSVIPGSKNPQHIAENVQVFDFALSDRDMQAIRALNKEQRVFPYDFKMMQQQETKNAIMMKEKKSMSRRDAIKTMGAMAAGAALSATGIGSLASCAKEKKRLVFYFTATGNSLYIARQLGDGKNEPLSIPQLLKNRQLEFEADEIGIVYPIYGHMPPNMVKEFLQTAKLKADYLFCVPTFGARKCSAVEIWDNLAKTCGYKFDYICTLMMVDNWLHAFDMNEQIKMDKHIPEQLAKIQEDIAAHRQWHEPTTQEERDMHAGFMQFSGLSERDAFLMSASERFVIEGNCIGCGICTEVCPRGNYELTSKGVTANGQCDYCLACIHACPQKAIQFRPSENPLLGPEPNPKARFRNEHISLMDIKRANNQH